MKPSPLALLATLYLLSAPGEAATIAWDTPQTVSGPADMSTVGTGLYAYNISADAIGPVNTLNGVTFQRFAVAATGIGGFPTSVTLGSVNLSSAAPYRLEGHISDLGGHSVFGPLVTAYQDLLFGGASPAGGAMTLTLGGLTDGEHYQVQLWSNDSTSSLNPLHPNALTQVTAGNSVILDMAVGSSPFGGLGQWVTGTFTATGATQAVVISGVAGVEPALNAFQVRTVPEPASALLLAASAFPLLLRRRR